MSGYLRNVIYTGQFDGDTVTVVMRPLELGDALKLRQLPADSDQVSVLAELLSRYVLSVSGLRANDGTEVTKEEMLAGSYFAQLMANAAMELLNSASPKSPKA